MSRNRCPRCGFTYAELLIAALLLSIVSAAAFAGWGISVRAPANKRVTEMAVFIGVQELERRKAQTYLFQTADVRVQYYDKHGAPVTAAVAKGYKAKSWSTVAINRDRATNTEDLLEIRIEVWNNEETQRYENIQTLMAFGGM
jgi:type II secretory pathway pseudopilin PulG